MTSNRANRREFFRGQGAGDALRQLADHVAKTSAPESGDAPQGALAHNARPAQNGAPRYLVQVQRRAMACQFEILQNAGEYPEGTAAALAALDLVDDIEAQLSVYQPTSEVSRLNVAASRCDAAVSGSLLSLLLRAQELARDTAGAFDVTAGPLVKAWGFFERQGKVPSPDALAAARASVGYKHLRIDATRRTLRFGHPGMEINLGAIGKGYALDRAAALLVERGVGNFLMHGGQSSVLAQGQDASTGNGWEVGLRDPWRPQRRLAFLRLRDRAVGTSGAGTQFFRDQGRRYGHILDPRTGMPADGVISATAVTRSAADADALATAFYCLGPEAACRYCEQRAETGAILVIPSKERDGVEIITAGLGEDDLTLCDD